MKVIAIAALLATVICVIPLVQAIDWALPYNNLSSGYRVTTDKHGQDVPIGTPVTAYAATTNPNIVEVKFRWNPPDGSDPIIVALGLGDRVTDTLPDSVTTFYYWSNTQTVDILGDWGVQGVFYEEDPDTGIGPIKDQPGPVAIRARSFLLTPEVAIGSIMAVAAMFTALGLFAYKKKHTSTK